MFFFDEIPNEKNKCCTVLAYGAALEEREVVKGGSEAVFALTGW